MLFGDERQLESLVVLKEMNEFGSLAELSLFRLLLRKGADMIALSIQYRFLRDIAVFVDGEYYDENLKPAASRMQPGATALKVIAVSEKAPYSRGQLFLGYRCRQRTLETGGYRFLSGQAH